MIEEFQDRQGGSSAGRTRAQDLKQAFPELGKGLQQLLDFEGDVEGTFCRTFEVEFDYFGEIRTSQLKPGGADIPVTNDNRREFVELYTKWLLHDSIQTQFSAFAHGFHGVRLLPSVSLRCGRLVPLTSCREFVASVMNAGLERRVRSRIGRESFSLCSCVGRDDFY